MQGKTLRNRHSTTSKESADLHLIVPFAGNTLEVFGDLEVPQLTIYTNASHRDIHKLLTKIGTREAKNRLELYRELIPTAVNLSRENRLLLRAELDAALEVLFSSDRSTQELLIKCYTALAERDLHHDDVREIAAHTHQTLQRSLILAKALGNGHWLATIQHRFGTLGLLTGDIEQSVTCYQTSEELFQKCSTDELAAAGLCDTAFSLVRAGKASAALRMFEKSGEIAANSSSIERFFTALMGQGYAYAAMGELSEAQKSLDFARELFGSTFDVQVSPLWRAAHYKYLAYVALSRGDLDCAERAIEAAGYLIQNHNIVSEQVEIRSMLSANPKWIELEPEWIKQR